jgi:hypothetical protein
MKPIYRSGDRFYKQLKPPGSGRGAYALWQPVRKFLCFYLAHKNTFWLDMEGFEPVNRTARKQFKRLNETKV